MSSLLSKLSKFVSKYVSTWMVFAMDVVLSLLATAVTVLIAIFVLNVSGLRGISLVLCFVMSLLFTVASILIFKSNKVIIRHSTFKDNGIYVLVAAVKSSLMLLVAGTLEDVWPAFVVDSDKLTLLLLTLLDFLLTTFFTIAARFVLILFYSVLMGRIQSRKDCSRLLLYSTCEKSVAMLTRLKNSPHYKIVGFVSSDIYKKSFTVSELLVFYLGDRESVAELKERIQFDAILFSRERDIQKEKGRLIEYATKESVKVLVAPEIDEIDENGTLNNRIREVRIEDLLGREEIRISLDDVIANFKGKTVLVTGAAGSIGSELCRQLAGFGVEQLILFDNGETPMHNLRLEFDSRFPNVKYVPVIGDVRIPKRLDFVFRTYHPQVVFHAAAYKHVPLMEENPCEAVLVNVVGTRNVADKCVEYGVEKMVMISTDKAVNPTNIMGCTKRLAEIYVQSLGLAIENGRTEGRTKFVTTRFGNVLGSNGSVIPRFRDQIANGGPVTVTHPDITRFFMTIPEACLLVMEAATMPTANRICVFDMGQSVKIDTLARKMIELAGLKPDEDIKIEYTGLRPGEKLYEEVLSNVENTDPTSHDRIRIARVRMHEYGDAVEFVDRLETLSRDVDIPTMVKLMKKIVPEYVSNNSKYSEYDEKR